MFFKRKIQSTKHMKLNKITMLDMTFVPDCLAYPQSVVVIYKFFILQTIHYNTTKSTLEKNGFFHKHFLYF